MKAQRKNPIDGLGPDEAKQARCSSCLKVLMVARTRMELLVPVMMHWEEKHGALTDDVNVLVEGVDGHFTVEQAPHRCDLCGTATEPPFWTYFTPHSDDYPVQDEGWLVCDACQPLVEAHDVIGLVKELMEVNLREFDVDATTMREHALSVIPGFLSHVDLSRTTRGMEHG